MTKDELKEIDEFAACRRFVRQVRKCADCLHYAECLASERPVALAAREFAEFDRICERVNAKLYKVIMPPIRQRHIKATASCRQVRSSKYKYCLAIAYDDRTFDYLNFEKKPALDELIKVVYIIVNGHFGKDTTL